MSISAPREDNRIKGVDFRGELLTFLLEDGREISAPLSWYPKLFEANDTQRQHWQHCHGGRGIHWPYLDEDLTVAGLLAGIPAPGGFFIEDGT